MVSIPAATDTIVSPKGALACKKEDSSVQFSSLKIQLNLVFKTDMFSFWFTLLEVLRQVMDNIPALSAEKIPATRKKLLQPSILDLIWRAIN